MKVVTTRTGLQQIVAMAARVAAKKGNKHNPINPQLRQVIIEASNPEDDGLHVRATDGAVGYAGTTKAIVEAGGRVAVSAKDLHNIVRYLPDLPVQLESHRGTGLLELRCGSIAAQLGTECPDPYPEMAVAAPDVCYPITVEDLCRLIDSTIFATCRDGTRHYLAGVHFVCNPGEHLSAIACAGTRMAVCEVVPSPDMEISPGHTIPHKTINDLRHMLRSISSASTVTWGFDDKAKLVRFDCGGQTITGGLIMSGEFPDWRSVIPKTTNMTILVPRMQLLRAIARIKRISKGTMQDGGAGVRLHLIANRLAISGKGGCGTGLAILSEDLLVEGWGDIKVGFDAQFLTDALKAIHTKDVQIEFINHISPCMLRPLHEPDKDGNTPTTQEMHVLMPYRMGDDGY